MGAEGEDDQKPETSAQNRAPQHKNPILDKRGVFDAVDWNGPATRAVTSIAMPTVKPSGNAPFRVTNAYQPPRKGQGFAIAADPAQTEADSEEIGMDAQAANEDTQRVHMKRHTALEDIMAIDEAEASRQQRHRQNFLKLLKGSTANQEKPRQGGCIYMQLDLNTLIQSRDPGTLIDLFEELKTIRKPDGKISDEYAIHVDEESGDLIVMALSERASNSILALSTSIASRILGAKTFLGMGKIVHETVVEIDKGTGEQTRKEARALHARITNKQKQSAITEPGAIFLTEELADRINTPRSREGSLCEIRIEKSATKGLLRLTKYTPKVSLDTGAEKVIGVDDKIEALTSTLLDPDVKLIMVKGHAGIGKTTILNAALNNLPGFKITCSFDPSFSGKECTPHGGLVTMIEQIATTIKEHPQLEKERTTNKYLIALLELSQKPRSERMTETQKNPASVTNLCLNAIEEIRRHTPRGEAVLILEDLHHIDSASEPYVMSITQGYMARDSAKDNGGKVLLSMRPEEMLKSVYLKKLIQTTGIFHQNAPIVEMEIDGLDFADPKISEEFAFYSIPKKIREGKKLGTWHETLGKKAGRIPLRMKAFMAKVKDHLIVDEATGIINVDKSVLAEISAIESDEDFDTYSRRRISKLPQQDQTFLQALALIGGYVSTKAVQEIIFGHTKIGYTGEPAQTLNHLITGEYITTTKSTVAFSHHTIRDTVLASMDEDTKFQLAMYLNDAFKVNPKEYHPDARFALLQHIATNSLQPEPNEPFWQEYAEAATQSNADAEKKLLLTRGFSIANSISESATIYETTNLLKEGNKTIPKHLRDLVIQTLFTLAKTGQHLNKQETAEKALADLQEIHEHFPEEVDLVEIKMLQFQTEYLKTYYSSPAESKKKLRELYNQLLPDLIARNPALAFVLEIKTLYREGKLAEAIASGNDPLKRVIITTLNTQFAETHDSQISPDFAEIRRLLDSRIPIEELRTRFKTKKWEGRETKTLERNGDTAKLERRIKANDFEMHVDDDIEFSPQLMTTDERLDAKSLLQKSQEIAGYKKTGHRSIFNPTAETMVGIAEAEMLGYLGRYDEAIEMFGETWRQANQKDVAEAVRAGQKKGDLYIMRAYTKKKGEVDLEDIELAIQTYSNECMISLAPPVEKNNWWQFGVRIQRIRAIGKLLLSVRPDQNKGLPPKYIEHLKQHIEKALEDFSTINSTFSNYVVNENGQPTEGGEEYAYYASSYMGYILAIAENLGIDVKEFSNEEAYPFLRKDVVKKAYDLGETFLDGELLDEVATKRSGLLLLDKDHTEEKGIAHEISELKRKMKARIAMDAAEEFEETPDPE